jgi:uncharacterized protein (TIGR02246 family)
MDRHSSAWTGIAGLVVAAAAWWVSSSVSPAEDRAAPDDEGAAESASSAESAAMAAVKKTAAAFMEAFNSGDAAAVAAFWTKDGEYVGPDEESLRGRGEIEKSYTEFFKEHPESKLEVTVESVRLLGRQTALEEGELKLSLADDEGPAVSRYSVLHVREDDGWRMASVREWVPDPQETVSLKDVEWLLGEWTAEGPEARVSITYSWDEDQAFLRGRFVLKKGDEVINSGTQLIGKNPAGGLRSWVFDRNGTFGESVWLRDGDHWVIDAAGTLPDGSETTAVNILIPLGADEFTWQSLERTAAGSPLPGTPPVKVTRAKTDR